MLPPGLPDLTLGYGVLEWCSANLLEKIVDDEPVFWEFSKEQARFLAWWYAVDENGRWIYRRGVLERPKGWGKSPFLAAICLAELFGPVVFDHFEGGEPVGRRYQTCRVQVAASALDQTDYTFNFVRQMLGAEADTDKELSLFSPLRRQYPGLTVSKYKVACPGRVLEARTAAATTEEGSRVDFAVLDETHLLLPNNNGIALWEVYDRNTVKRARAGGGRYIEATNAPVPGEGSVAEMTHDAYDAIRSGLAPESEKILFDTREVFLDDILADKEATFEAWRYLYGDSVDPVKGWVDLEAFWGKINSPTSKDHTMRRFYFNQRLRHENNWMQDGSWLAARRPGLQFDPDRDAFTLGFKGGHRTAAALVACRAKDGAVFLLHKWNRPQPNETNYNPKWEVPYAIVDKTVRGWLGQKKCLKLLAHPDEWQDIIGRWAIDYPAYEVSGHQIERVEEFELNGHSPKKASLACEQFETAVRTGRVIHDSPKSISIESNDTLSDQVAHCFQEETSYGFLVRKMTKHSPLFICAAEAAVLAFEACVQAIEDGALAKPASTMVYAF